MAFSFTTPQRFLQDIRHGVMAQERNVYLGVNCDVVVSLVRRTPNIAANASTYQNYPSEYANYAMKRARLSNPLGEYEVNLGEVHMNSSQLRRCSKYFDACLSERWARGGAEINTVPSATPVCFTLDVHTDAQYYRECFSRMYSNKYNWMPNVHHCLKLLQVASQISFLELVEYCVHYLNSIPWSPIEEEGIRQFANSVFYPSDCAVDLSARLGLALTNTEKHGRLLGIMERQLCQLFNDFLRLDDVEYCCEQLFTNGFRLIIAGAYPTIVENVLQHVYNCVKQLILEAKEDPESACGFFYHVEWTLNLLLETGYAKGLVEYIVDESPLCEMLKMTPALKSMVLVFALFCNVVKGQLVLKTSTRYKLIKEWTWILLQKNYDRSVGLQESDIYEILITFVLTFPYETQEEIISDWMAYYTGPLREEYNLHFMKIQGDWFASLEKETKSLLTGSTSYGHKVELPNSASHLIPPPYFWPQLYQALNANPHTFMTNSEH